MPTLKSRRSGQDLRKHLLVAHPDYIYTRDQIAAAREAQLKMVVVENRRLREALIKICRVEGEDDPATLWPWAQQVAQEALEHEEAIGLHEASL